MTVKDLSTTAQAILASHWGLGPDCKVTLGNEVSRMTSRSREAMSELIVEGFVQAEKADDGRAESLTYTLTEKGKSADLRKSMSWMEKHGKFPFTEKIQ